MSLLVFCSRDVRSGGNTALLRNLARTLDDGHLRCFHGVRIVVDDRRCRKMYVSVDQRTVGVFSKESVHFHFVAAIVFYLLV